MPRETEHRFKSPGSLRVRLRTHNLLQLPQKVMREISQLRRIILISGLVLGVVFSTTHAAPSAQTQPAPAKNIFHTKYISDDAVYLDAGRNAGLEVGMLLHLVHADPSG